MTVVPGATPAASDPSAIPVNPGLPNQFAQDVNGDWNVAQKRFHDLTQHTRGIQQQNQAFAEQLANLEQRFTQAQPQGAGYLSQLAEQLNVSPQMLAGALTEVAQPIVRQTFAPINNALGARTALATELPEFIKHESEVFQWAGTRPDLLSMATQMNNKGFAREASQLLFREWQAANPPSLSIPTPPPASAQLPPVGGGPAPTGAQNQEQQDAAQKAFRERLNLAIQTKDIGRVSDDLYGGMKWLAPQSMGQGQ